MFAALVRFSIERRVVVLTLALVLAGYGLARLSEAGLDIFPEFAPQLVIIQTEAPGLTAEQVEIHVTRPLETALGGLIDLAYMTSESIQGLSVVTLVFEERSDIWRNRAQVAERLVTARAQLPATAGEPVIAPLASASATIRTIGLSADDEDMLRLRDVAATVMIPRLLGVPGVADVNVFGGLERALVVTPDPHALARHGIDIGQLALALRRASTSASTGLGVIESATQQFAIAADAGTLDPQRLGAALVQASGLARVTVADLAAVDWAGLPRISAAAIDGQPGVVMMVIGQLGANTLTVSRALERTLTDLAPVLARQGVTLHTDLFVPARYVTTAIGDITLHLLIGASLVLLVLVIGLQDWRAAFISALAIPLSLLAALVVLIEAGVNLNVLVIGGLAIALGEVVDDAIIDTENIRRRLREAACDADPQAVALDASLEVRGSVVYATFIVALVFVPLLMLGGVSGRLFAPLGLAYILAVMASLAVALTVTPALCVALLSGRRQVAGEALLFRALNPLYSRAVAAVARRPAMAVGASLLCAFAVAIVLPGFGARFLPELREGHFIVHTTALPGTSLDESIRMGSNAVAAFREIEGVRSVSQWAGRAARGADTYGSHYSEYEVALEPMDGTRQQAVLDALRTVLAHHAGWNFEANTFLTERIDETISGYTAPIVVNLFGDDLEALDRRAAEIAALITSVRGARNVRLRSAQVTPQVSIALDPARLVRRGVSAGDVLAAVQAAYAGHPLGETRYGARGVAVVMLLDAATRARVELLENLAVAQGPAGVVRLGDVATVRQEEGRYNVLHRDGQRLQVVTAEVDGRNQDAFLAELRARVLDEIALDAGMHVEFTGAAVEQARARRALVRHALMCTVGVLLLVLLAVGRMRHLLLILFNLPFALLGGVIVMALGGGVVTVGSTVGFVTLFGITVRNTIMLVSHYDHLVRIEGRPWNLDTALRGARERLPAILMTALVTALAMLPLTLDSDNAGREIMGPMAAIIIGGLASSTLLNLLVMPALLLRYGRFTPPSAR